jgi:hypothetical protein
MSHLTRRLRRPIVVLPALVFLVSMAAAPVAMATGGAGHGGKPTIERDVIEETFFDDFILDVCGVETFTTQTEVNIIKTFPDGSQTVHRRVQFVPDDPNIASERWARTDFFAPDGTERIVGLAIRLYRHGEGTIIRDAGWVQVLEDGLVIRGPHPFLENQDEAEQLYC